MLTRMDRVGAGLRRAGAGLCAGLLAVAAGCFGGGGWLPPSEAQQSAAYQAAIADAQDPTPAEIYTGLTAITPDNPNLVWEGTPGASRLLAVAYSTYGGYANLVGQTTTLPVVLWVTTAPELQQFLLASRTPASQLDLRTRELLGLPPASEDDPRNVVVVWVNPSDLFRPSRDPEITDQESSLVYPAGWYTPASESSYVSWFDNWVTQAYTGSYPYPFTQLGYTYDWGGSPADDVGLSEFGVRSGAQVTVVAYETIEQYVGSGR